MHIATLPRHPELALEKNCPSKTSKIVALENQKKAAEASAKFEERVKDEIITYKDFFIYYTLLGFDTRSQEAHNGKTHRCLRAAYGDHGFGTKGGPLPLCKQDDEIPALASQQTPAAKGPSSGDTAQQQWQAWDTRQGVEEKMGTTSRAQEEEQQEGKAQNPKGEEQTVRRRQPMSMEDSFWGKREANASLLRTAEPGKATGAR
ncbi:hypothetical protein HGM15179_020596 [Zosterops borbonicus]|uniref:Uncharacterized protein n=1 Tax=Zosterops borbonicus TaxID=364589 RepID=A0A8K1D622_9PASS|nr:hypothetical protein HGM15179_020596 [Zosterops borbonicus]